MIQVLVLTAFLACSPADGGDLRTVAERSEFRATATHAEVMDLLGRIAAESGNAFLTEIGRTSEDRAIPLIVFADPPVRSPAAACASGKPIVFAFGDIHAGEVCGKEALLMFARELATTPRSPLLDDVVIALAPIYNGDGNDRMDPGNRPGQIGPELGMGQRPNAQGFDLNRDWVKLESPEARAMVRFLTEWDPHVTIDTHTTNGSEHRYTLTYSAPLNPSGYAPSIEFVRDELLPTITKRMLERTGYDSFFYGNFDREHTTWTTYSADPRFGGPYRGLRGQMSILSEAYAYATYRDRVLATLAFVHLIAEYTVEHADRVLALHAAARAETTRIGGDPQPSDAVGIRHRVASFAQPVVLHGWSMIHEEGRRPRRTNVHAEHRVDHFGRFEPTLSVRRPRAYVLEPGLDGVVSKLRQHGIRTEEYEGTERVSTYRIDEIARAERAFQGHRMVTLEVTERDEERSFATGSTLVTTQQPLGTLVVYLLEPQSTDGLAAWNFFDERIAVGADFPAHRIE